MTQGSDVVNAPMICALSIAAHGESLIIKTKTVANQSEPSNCQMVRFDADLNLLARPLALDVMGASSRTFAK